MKRARLTLLCGLLLSACGGQDAAIQAQTVRGAVVKGPVQQAQIDLFLIDEAGFPSGAPIATVISDGNGRFDFQRPAGTTDALLAVTRGGSFVDESDPEPNPQRKRRIILGPEQILESVLPAGRTTLIITPYTYALLERARRLAGGVNFLTFYDALVDLSTQAIGFDVTQVIPEPPLAPNPNASLQQRQYALLLGGFAYANHAQSAGAGTIPDFETIRASIDDLSDGRLDGFLEGQNLGVFVIDSFVNFPLGVNINAEIIRFRNNTFDISGMTPPPQIDEDLLAAGINIGNQPPLARDDQFVTDEDLDLEISAPGVLANDLDSETFTLQASLVTPPANGSIELEGDGGFLYQPNADFSGTDSFVYRASDGVLGSNDATVNITVNASNDPPSAQDDAFELDVNGGVIAGAPGVLGNDSDPEGDSLIALVLDPPGSGQLTLNPDGSFEYFADETFIGSDSFTYQADDGTARSGIATVTITEPPNAAPTASDDLFFIDESGALTVAAPGVLQNDGDDDGDTLQAQLISLPTAGSVSLNPDGSFTYVADFQLFDGSDSFTYIADDGRAASNPATVTIQFGEPL